MGASLVALAYLAFVAQPASAVAGRSVTLTLPHELRAGETAWLEVSVGVIGHAEIEITTPNGRSLGVISPYAVRPGHPAGTYIVPVPAEAITGDRLPLRVFLNRNSHALRAPTAKEVTAIRVQIRSAKP
jgi:virulence-associated protein VagC